VPAYNEADRIAGVVGNLRKVLDGLSEEYEILPVDDGSTDSTLEKARELEKLHNGIVKVLSYGRNIISFHYIMQNARFFVRGSPYTLHLNYIY